MGAGKTERPGNNDSLFTRGRRINATNDSILRNLRVKGGSIRKVGDKWFIVPQANNEDTAELKTITYKDAETHELKTAGIRATEDINIEPNSALISPDECSLSHTDSEDTIQIFGFDDDTTVALGLQDCLEVVKGTQRLSAVNGSQYELLVRVKSEDGSVRAMGYMPIGESTGEDPLGTKKDECAHDTYPDGSGGGGGGGGGDGSGGNRHDAHPAIGTGESYSRPSGEHPAKKGPCW